MPKETINNEVLPLDILCLDLEGVLIPEIWQAVAERTAVEELRKTTRDIPDYGELMQFRLEIMRREDLRFSLIREVAEGLEPLPGARSFLDEARRNWQPVIVSDTFYEFAAPLMGKLGWPTLLCHRLVVENDRIAECKIRQPDPKRSVVKAFQSLNFRVAAAGDSYNDIPMLEEADTGVLFRAPAKVRSEHPQYAAAESYEELVRLLAAS